MTLARRGRFVGPALAIVATVVLAGLLVRSDSSPRLTVRDPDDGVVLATAALNGSPTFTLRYRNSLYGTVAEERFEVTEDGRLVLDLLAADQIAVLEEYYAIDTPAWAAPDDDAREWLAKPANPVTLDDLLIAATDLGERTLIVEGEEPIPLWRLEAADPAVVLRVED